jgi:hypothetical protein
MDNEFAKRVQQKLNEGMEKVRAARMEDERRRLMSTIGQDLAVMLQPFLVEIAGSAKANKKEMRDAMFEAIGALGPQSSSIDTAPIIGAIEAAFMNLQLPQPKVEVKLPDNLFENLRLPDPPDMSNVRGIMALLANGREVSYENPMPVIFYDKNGRPVNFFEGMKQVISGGGGGNARVVKIASSSDNPVYVSGSFTAQASGATQSVNVVDAFGSTAVSGLFNADNRLRVSVETGGSGLTDSELRASSVPVAQASGAAWSTSVNDIFGSVGTNVINPDGRVKVELPTGSSGLTDTELRASSVPVAQASGAIWSMQANDIFATTQASVVANPDNRVRVELPSFTQAISVTDIYATSVASDVVNPDNRVKVELPASSVLVNSADIFATTATSNVVNRDNRVKVELPATSVTVTSVTNSIAANIVDSGGVAYSGSNPLPITVVSGAQSTSAAQLTRQSNPTAVAADYVPFSADDLGRSLMRPIQVRDLIVTARAQVTNGTETTLLAASAGNFHDLIYVLGANNSDAAVSVDIRSVTAGNVVLTLQLPANGSAGVALPVPLPQDATGNNWTVDLPDITGSTVTIQALFSREI